MILLNVYLNCDIFFTSLVIEETSKIPFHSPEKTKYIWSIYQVYIYILNYFWIFVFNFNFYTFFVCFILISIKIIFVFIKAVFPKINLELYFIAFYYPETFWSLEKLFSRLLWKNLLLSYSIKNIYQSVKG